MAPLDIFRFDPNDSHHAFCKVCDKKLRVWTDNEKKDFTNLYRHYRVMHHTSIEKRPKYPTLKRSPCDLNNEGPQAKYHKVHDNPLFDQNLKHFENIGVMNIGKINEEEPSDYDTFHSNNGNNNNVEAKEFLNQAISSITEEMNYGFPRKISDALHSGVTYRIIAGYKKTNGNLVNDACGSFEKHSQ